MPNSINSKLFYFYLRLDAEPFNLVSCSWERPGFGFPYLCVSVEETLMLCLFNPIPCFFQQTGDLKPMRLANSQAQLGQKRSLHLVIGSAEGVRDELPEGRVGANTTLA